MAIEALAGLIEEDRSFGPFADSEVDGSGRAWRQRDGHGLAPFAQDGEGPVTTAGCWPVCPDHDMGLWAEVRDGSAVRRCRPYDHTLALVGSLGQSG